LKASQIGREEKELIVSMSRQVLKTTALNLDLEMSIKAAENRLQHIQSECRELKNEIVSAEKGKPCIKMPLKIDF
jgi:hypothetical protein